MTTCTVQRCPRLTILNGWNAAIKLYVLKGPICNQSQKELWKNTFKQYVACFF